ncbi:MAG TPA: LuxR C-terminal-related transcriptional regulator [Thermomicrobiales bacterium]|nr:LuxR C-terminal-related transcriptional regulator [Thermomicrobiales bacterium]
MMGHTMARLPAPLSSFVGRDAEIARIIDLLSSTRLLTLTGPGGVGKTRVSIALAERLAGDFPGGAWFVPLANIEDPLLVPSAVAAALGVIPQGTVPAADAIQNRLRDHAALVILDNFEQVSDAAPLVAELLMACSHLTIIATSRVPLRITGEQVFPIFPMSLPEIVDRLTVDQLLANEAVALFVVRARAALPDFALTAGNAVAVAGICRRLDGLPLAIELAAAWSRTLLPHALLERLDRALPLLTGGARDAPMRQQTMRNTIAWSYDLLGADEQRLFRQLSVFSGGWTLEAAEAVCQPGGDPASPGSESRDTSATVVLGGLSSLSDKSLLLRITSPAGPESGGRFGLLETIREFGLERLEQSGRAEAVRERHAACYLSVAEAAAHYLDRSDPERWLRRLDAEHANLLAALDWLLAQRDAERGLRLTGALREFWFMRGRLAEGMTRAEAFLALPEAAAPTRARALALATAGWLARWLNDTTRSIACCEEALAIWDSLKDPAHGAWLYNAIGMAAQDLEGIDAACDYWNRGLRFARETGDDKSRARLLFNLGHAAIVRNEPDHAAEHLGEALSVATTIADNDVIALVKYGLGRLAHQQGDHPHAAMLFRESLELYQKLDMAWGVARAVGKLAIMAQVNDDTTRAARLFGAAEALHVRIASPMTQSQRDEMEPAIAAARYTLGEAAYAAAFAQGGAMSLEAAINEALQGATTPEELAVAESPLSPREMDVLRLVAEGRSNQEIGSILFISHFTVARHVTSILNKLGLESRTAAAAWFVKQRLS